jgi:hypothetical protein
MPVSKVANGQLIQDAQYNGLVDAIQDPEVGHNHTGDAGYGRQILLSDIVDDGAPGGSTVSYAEIDAHVNATEEVHGLGADAHVLGAQGQGMLVQYGQESDDTVTFPIAYDNANIFIVITGVGELSGTQYLGYQVHDVSASGFQISKGADSSATYNWIAIGPKAP